MKLFFLNLWRKRSGMVDLRWWPALSKVSLLNAAVVGYKFGPHQPAIHSTNLFLPFCFINFFFSSRAAQRQEGWNEVWWNQMKWNSFAAEGWAPSHNPQIQQRRERKQIQLLNQPTLLVDELDCLSFNQWRREEEMPHCPFRNQRNSNQSHPFFLFWIDGLIGCFCWLLHSLTALSLGAALRSSIPLAGCFHSFL